VLFVDYQLAQITDVKAVIVQSIGGNVSVVVRGGVAVALSPTKTGLGSLVTNPSVPGRANSNAGGTEQITTTRKKNTKPKCTSKKKASVNQNTDSKPPGKKKKKSNQAQKEQQT